MERNAKFDLTQGNILSRLLTVALPIMGTQFVQMAYNMTDMFWVGRLSSSAVAATGMGGMFLWLSASLMMIGRMGSEIGVSQNLGRKDYDSARSYAQNAFVMALVLGIAYGGLLLFFSPQLISIFAMQEAEVAADAATYLAICGIGIPFTYLTAVITGAFNGAGNSRLSFVANITGLAVNVVLDPVLIFGMNLGVAGAAWATILAQLSVTLVFLWAIKHAKSRPFMEYTYLVKPSFDKVKTIIRWTTPIALESMLFCSLAMISTRIVTSFGTNALTVQNVGSQIESLSWLIAGGFGSAVTAFVGQNYGAGKWTRIRQGFRMSMLAMTVWGLMVMATLALFGHSLYSFFITDNPEVLEMGQRYLRVLCLCQVTSCWESVVAGTFRGIGRTNPPSVVSISVNVFRVILAIILSNTSMGLTGVWWAITIASILRGSIVTIWYLWESRSHPREDLAPAAPAS